MEFGKLKDISKVDFTLPPDPVGGQPYFLDGNSGEKTTPTFYIGCTGWSMPEWVGSIYPTGAKSKDFLKYYGRQFNTIELNTTHYRIPTLETVEKWKADTPEDFRFCPKVPQTISHSRDLGLNSPQLLQFYESIQALEEKLGCCFLQVPPYFGPDRLPLLTRFLEQLPTHIPMAVELRHEDWFADEQARGRLFTLLENHQVACVLTDVAGRRDILHMRLTCERAMIRFVGNALHPTDFLRIDEWGARLEAWRKTGLNEVYFFTHEPDNLLAPQLADYLCRAVKKRSGFVTRGPQLNSGSEGQQMQLF